MQMGSKAIEFFYKNVIESSSDEESDGENKFLFTAANMMKNHHLLSRRRGGSSVKRKANTGRDHEGGHVHLMRDYFHLTNPVYIRSHSVAAIGCLEHCSWRFLMA
jgi:hypothetical protein